MFDENIFNSTNKTVGCKEAVKALTDQIDQVWASGDKDEIHATVQTFGGKNLDIVQFDFMFYIADIFTTGVMYGTR